MATARLVPSSYRVSSTYLSVSSANNMYTNTDSTTYATVQNTRSGTSSYYIYIQGFNFDSVPNNAIVSNIQIKLKAYHSGGNTGTINCYTYNGTTATAINAAGSTTALSTSATVKEFTNVTIDWDTLKGYGANFGIRINGRRSNRNTAAYLYIYGAEILVTYTLPVYHTVTATGDGTLDPSGAKSVLEGDSYTLKISGITPTVTDNNIDVTSQLIQSTEITDVLVPNNYTNNGFTISNINNAYNDADNTNYADLTAPAGRRTSTIYLDMSDANIPSSATIVSVSCRATLQYNRNGSSSGFTASCQMYAGSTAKGSSTSVVTAGGTDVAKTTFNLNVGSWTASEIDNARFFLTVTNNASGTQRHMYIYGVSFSVTYESDGVVYIYTISNVQADHTIIVTASAQTQTLYFKENGTYVNAIKAWKKINGVYVQQQDLSTVFQSGVNYRKGGN